MLKIEKGGEYVATRVRSGDSGRGPWELLIVKEESRAHREVVIFTTKVPSGVQEGGRFRINEIISAGPRRSKNPDGTWSTYEKTSIEANVEPVDQNLDDFGGPDDLGDAYDPDLGLL